MDIQLELTLSNVDKRDLAEIIGCTQQELPQALPRIINAAAREYVTMFLGQKVFSRGSDILEYRLFLLIQEAFENRIPDEQDVSRIFQTTKNESRSLIRSVMSKYQYQLRDAIDRAIIRILEAAEHPNDETPFIVTINSINLLDELNRVLAEIDGNLPPVAKKRGSVSTYEIEASSYFRLCERFHAEPIG
jgi:hypothetical protein